MLTPRSHADHRIGDQSVVRLERIKRCVDGLSGGLSQRLTSSRSATRRQKHCTRPSGSMHFVKPDCSPLIIVTLLSRDQGRLCRSPRLLLLLVRLEALWTRPSVDDNGPRRGHVSVMTAHGTVPSPQRLMPAVPVVGCGTAWCERSIPRRMMKRRSVAIALHPPRSRRVDSRCPSAGNWPRRTASPGILTARVSSVPAWRGGRSVIMQMSAPSGPCEYRATHLLCQVRDLL